jgi:hypothetical protein
MTESNDHNERAYEAAAALRKKQVEGKNRMRKSLAALSITEKIKILEKLRDREHIISAAGLRRQPR